MTLGNYSRAILILSAVVSIPLTSVLPFSVSHAAPPQDIPCRSGTWRVLVGAVENVDAEHRNLEVRIRGGASGVPDRWASEDWAKSPSFSAGQFSARDFTLQIRPNADQKARFSLAPKAALFRAMSQGLDTAKLDQIEVGAPILLVLEAGRCWPGSESETLPIMSEPRISKIVLLQACIEESCVKVRCKGKTECKERVCNCAQAQ